MIHTPLPTHPLRQLPVALLALATLVVIGCAESAAPPGGTSKACTADNECLNGQHCDEGRCVADATNNGNNDVFNNVTNNATNNATNNNGVNNTTNNGTNNPPVPGAQGAPCDVDADCRSNYCIQVPGDGRKLCTDFCSDATVCPDGWSCQGIGNSGPDIVFVCYPDSDFLCRACTDDVECGGRSDRCIDVLDGSFCGRDCANRDCPEGYDCIELTSDDGSETTQQCQPSNNFCGDCFDPDQDGYGVGDACLGTDCDEGDGTRNPGALEICDHIDNNCNDEVDEGIDITSDVRNCNGCGNSCMVAGAEAACVDSQCQVGRCLDNFWDLDPNLEGCEYECVFVSDTDEPDPEYRDTNCDGIDGDVRRGIFVDVNRGDDNNDGTQASPVASITKGIFLARNDPNRDQVYVKGGVYNGRLVLRGGVSVFGGYGERWIRNPAASPTTVRGDFIGVEVFRADGVVRMEGFAIEASTNTADGGSSYGVFIRETDQPVFLRYNTIIARDGSAGTVGNTPSKATSGGAGGRGENGCDGCSGAGTGGTAGTGPCNNGGGVGGMGGHGGNDGARGGDGTQASGGASAGGGGAGGAKASACYGDGDRGGTGTGGTGGENGNNGMIPADQRLGALDGNGYWTAFGGLTASPGTPGGGGGAGGGGGGGRSTVVCRADRGGGGGGGGGGGCGGDAGGGGGGGGGSFGVFLLGSTQVTLENNTITSANGGRGGNGGTGGQGGDGGSEGGGGNSADDAGGGGGGAAGGNGGSGGGGAGGAGGATVCIFLAGGPAPTYAANGCTRGGAGGGGTGGTGGSGRGQDGEMGLSAERNF